MTKAETKTFLALLEEVPEYRKGNAIKYSLRDVLFLAIFAILCGAETYTGMQVFSERRSQSGTHRAFHVETAYLSDRQIVLGQTAVDEKSNELKAIPELLKMLALKECTVTIDAMGTHANIAKAIREAEAEYILPVKENQPTLLEDIKLYAEEDVLKKAPEGLKKEGRYAIQNDKGHGRIERRECYLFDRIDWLKERHEWTDLNGVAMIRSQRTMTDTGETSSIDRYYIYSHKEMTADRFLTLQRKHWAIENNLHWCLDCCFHEDDMHVRLGHAAIVINALRKLCMQMLKADTSVKDSLAGKRQRCAWSFDYAISVASGFALASPVS